MLTDLLDCYSDKGDIRSHIFWVCRLSSWFVHSCIPSGAIIGFCQQLMRNTSQEFSSKICTFYSTVCVPSDLSTGFSCLKSSFYKEISIFTVVHCKYNVSYTWMTFWPLNCEFSEWKIQFAGLFKQNSDPLPEYFVWVCVTEEALGVLPPGGLSSC